MSLYYTHLSMAVCSSIIINRNKLMYPNILDYIRSTSWISALLNRSSKNMKVSSSCLETKMKFISGKIMKRHHHHHHLYTEDSTSNHKMTNCHCICHCIYTYKPYVSREHKMSNVMSRAHRHISARSHRQMSVDGDFFCDDVRSKRDVTAVSRLGPNCLACHRRR